jgi:hypothetical protein
MTAELTLYHEPKRVFREKYGRKLRGGGYWLQFDIYTAQLRDSETLWIGLRKSPSGADNIVALARDSETFARICDKYNSGEFNQILFYALPSDATGK